MNEPQPQMLMDSLAAGNTDAMCWAKTGGDEATLLWDKGTIVFYLTGTSTSSEVAGELAVLFEQTNFPLAADTGLTTFYVLAVSTAMEEIVPHVFRDVQLQCEHRYFYAHLETTVGDEPLRALSEVVFRLIDADLLSDHNIANLQCVREEIQ